MQANQAPTAEGDKASVENLSAEALFGSLATGSPQESEPTEQEEVTEEQSEEATEEVTEEVADEVSAEEETEESESEEEEESQEIDLLSLSPEQIKELAKKGKSRLLERIGELTAQKKALQQQLEEFGSKTAPEVPQEENPFRDVASIEEVKSKQKEWAKTLEYTDQLLEEYEDYGPDDIITVGNQEFTKRKIKEANKNARNAITKFLPAQADHLQRLESYKVAGSQWEAAAKQEVPEILDEESDVGKAYKALVSDPLVKKLKDNLPELGVQIEYILAHAARSKFGKSKPKIAQGAGSKLKVKPPASPVGAGAAKGGGTSQASKYKEAMAKAEKTGRAEDLVAAMMMPRS